MPSEELEFLRAELECEVRAKNELMNLVERQMNLWALAEELLSKLGHKDAANSCRMLSREGRDLVEGIRKRAAG